VRTPGFERTGSCERCGWFGGLDQGLCIACSNDPELTVGPATCVAGALFAHLKQCIYCGHDHDSASDLCPRCRENATRELERWGT
jgi:hypothetical protein